MTPTYAYKLGLAIRQTNVGAQKVNKSPLKTYGIVIASLRLKDKLKKI